MAGHINSMKKKSILQKRAEDETPVNPHITLSWFQLE